MDPSAPAATSRWNWTPACSRRTWTASTPAFAGRMLPHTRLFMTSWRGSRCQVGPVPNGLPQDTPRRSPEMEMPGRKEMVRRLVPRSTDPGFGNPPLRARSRQSWRSHEGRTPIWEDYCSRSYGVERPEDLTIRQASELIDLLKAPAEA